MNRYWYIKGDRLLFIVTSWGPGTVAILANEIWWEELDSWGEAGFGRELK